MDSDSYLERRSGHMSRYDLEEPHFQHKRRMNGSPSRYAREPDLPIRKKIPKDEELNNNRNDDDDDDFIILGDQSKFRLDMIPYRTRSHSAPRYSDSTDMLTWLGNGNDDDDFDHHYRHRRRSRTGDRHVNEPHNNNNTMVSDSHYHNCEDEPANRSPALQQLPRNDNNDQEFDASNIKARMQSPKKSEQNSPPNEDHKRVKVRPSEEATRTKSKQTTQQSTRNKPVATRPNSTRTNVLNNNSNNNKQSTTTFAAPRTKWNVNGKFNPRSQFNKTSKTSNVEFRTKSDVGKFLNDRHKERMKQKPNGAALKELHRNDEDDNDDSESSARGNRRERGTKAGKKSETSNESLGAEIANRSQQNKENVNNNVVINEEVLNRLDRAVEDHQHHHQPRSSHPLHSSHRSLSEYQDKFRWRGDPRPPLTTSSNLMKSQQPRLTWLTTEAPLGDVRSEYTDQFRPRSALERRRNHYHNQHHHNVMRENYVHPELAANRGVGGGTAGMNHQSLRGGDEDNYAEGYDGQFTNGMHEHSVPHQHENRRFKSEYSVKFIPPSDYLLVEGVWVKADHVQRILGDHNSTVGQSARWGEVRNGSGYHDRSLTAADLGANSTPYGGRLPVTNDDNIVDNNSNNMALEDLSPSRRQHLGDSWFDYILELRRKADEYRNRGFGVNFSRDHLAQIRSKNLRYWDESSLDSITAEEEEALHDRIGQRHNTLARPIVNTIHRNAIHYSTSNKVPGFFSLDQKFGTNPANQSDHENSALHNNNPSSNQQHNNNIAPYPGQHRYDDDPIGRTNLSKEVNLHQSRRRSNPIGGDSDDLADSLSSSLSLAEEVLERARTRKDRLWTTK